MRIPALMIAVPFTLMTLAATGAAAGDFRSLIAPIGEATGDLLGAAVRVAGDFNADGHDDVIVGAPQNDDAASDAGAAYLYFGGPDADDQPDITLFGVASADRFGGAVAGVGDYNGDGYDDVAVGARLNDTGNTNAGAVYVYYGGPGADGIVDLPIVYTGLNAEFGSSVAPAGDVNGDGRDDFVVGAARPSGIGLAYVYYGGTCGSCGDTTFDLALNDAGAGTRFGDSVGGAGDFNGDGYDDVIVGAPRYDGGGTRLGRAYLYFGGSSPDDVADAVWTGYADYDYLGECVAGAGDLNADGFDDVVVGGFAGEVYVFLGAPGAPPTQFHLVLGNASWFSTPGEYVGTVGDVNGDGIDDLGVGDTNALRVYFGGSPLDPVPDLTVTGDSNSLLGWSVAGAGDLDGDGLDDLLVGAPATSLDAGRFYALTAAAFRVLSPNGGETWVAGEPMTVSWLGQTSADLLFSPDAGASWFPVVTGVGSALGIGTPALNSWTFIAPGPATGALVAVARPGEQGSYLGSDTGDGTFRIVAPAAPVVSDLPEASFGEAAGDLYGNSVAGTGDVNGDGYDDVLVGARGNDAAGANAGAAYLFLGGPARTDTPDLVLPGAAAGEWAGLSVAGAGDVNGDGFDDMIAGAPFGSAGVPGAGAARVYFGGPVPDAVADLVLTGETADDFFGNAVAAAGDVNGDGYDDVVVGAYLYDLSVADADGGRAYVYFGGPVPDAVADLTLTGEACDDRFGASVSGAGDVNGDGYDDFLVGAFNHDTGGFEAGRAYLYLGGSLLDATADLVVTGSTTYEYLGFAVGGAGDLNGDGFADFVVGAHHETGTHPGSAFVYLGGVAPDAVPDLTLVGADQDDNFGFSVAGAGDVNADGFDDLVVGAPSAGAGSTGRVYVFHGGPVPDATPDAALNDNVGPGFGSSVGGAGDLDGDGFDDVVAGAFANDEAGNNAGKAVLFDLARYHLVGPSGGETWPVGAWRPVSWRGRGAVDIRLSVDGGASFPYLLGTGTGNDGGTHVTAVQVPHVPTAFARIRVVAQGESPGVPRNYALSDSLFTIEAEIALLQLTASPPPAGLQGVLVAWATDPGPKDLAGYTLERRTGSLWHTVVAGTRETSWIDPGGVPGSRYRLTGINRLGERFLVGETTFGIASALWAGPLPYQGGRLAIRFATLGGVGGVPGPAGIALYDARGRRVRSIAEGGFPAGVHDAAWDGLDAAGRPVPSGIYFLRVEAPGNTTVRKIPVIR
jgi:hypothetical protein